MIKNKRYYLLISVYFLFAVCVLIFPYFKNIDLDKVTTLLFCNFNYFEKLQLSKLSIKYIIIFIVFFHITFYQKLSIISENTSYLSMKLHKIDKKQEIKDILFINMIDFIKTYVFVLLWMFILGIGISFIQCIPFEYITFFHITIYLLKYFCFIYVMYCVYQIKCIIKNYSYFSLHTYILFMGLMISDMTFEISLITLSTSIANEFLWLLIVSIVGSVFLFITIYQFLKTKEVYND